MVYTVFLFFPASTGRPFFAQVVANQQRPDQGLGQKLGAEQTDVSSALTDNS
jgi:hypothetical protein